MSSSEVINEVSQLLRSVLLTGLPAGSDVVLTNPGDRADEAALSIWLYQVTPNEHLRNFPNVRIQNQNVDQLTPFPLDLCYLLTPLRRDESANQQTLGRALQILYDNAILTLNSGNNVEEIHVSMCQRSIEELAKVWEALQKPYRLSVCFEVRVVRIDSQRTLNAGRVESRDLKFEEVPEEVGV